MEPMNTNDVNTLPAPPETPLNPGIVRCVKLLNDNGFVTTDSGDGETHDFECDRPWSYIVVSRVEPTKVIDEVLRLRALLEANGMTIGTLGPEPADDDGVSIQAVWEAALPFAFIDVNNIHDRMLK